MTSDSMQLTELLRSLTRRGLRGVKRVISDSHGGLKKAVRKVMHATWQRCRVHASNVWSRPASAPSSPRRPSKRHGASGAPVSDPLRERFAKIARLMDEAEDDLLTHMSFPREHRGKLHSTNPLQRLNGEIKRRTNVVGIFPNEAAIYRLVGAMPLAQNNAWPLQRRYLTLQTLAVLDENPLVSLPAVAR